jgi:hypothetical protein
VVEVNLGTGASAIVGTVVNTVLTAVGWNPVDHSFYGWGSGGGIYKVGGPPTAPTAVQELDFWDTGEPFEKSSFTSGAFDPDGHLFLIDLGNDTGSSGALWIEVDLGSNPATYASVIASGRFPQVSGGAPSTAGDIAYINGSFWGVGAGGPGPNATLEQFTWNGTGFDRTMVGQVAGLPAFAPVAGSYVFGSAYSDGTYLYVTRDDKTTFRIDITTMVATELGTGVTGLSGSDAAKCMPSLTLAKQLNGDRKDPADSFTVGISAPGGGGVSATVPAGGTTAQTDPYPVKPGDVLTLTDAVGGASTTADYAPTISCTADLITPSQVAAALSGTRPTWTFTVPDDGDDFVCTIINEYVEPPPPSTTPPPTPPPSTGGPQGPSGGANPSFAKPGAHGPGGLPFTGSDSMTPLVIAFASLLAGAGLMAAARRVRTRGR